MQHTNQLEDITNKYNLDAAFADEDEEHERERENSMLEEVQPHDLLAIIKDLTSTVILLQLESDRR